MSATYLHVGIPVTSKKPGMTYNEALKIWLGNPEDYDYKIEYLKFEEGTPFPEIMHKNPHVAYHVDDLQHYIDDADSLLFGPADLDEHTVLAFVVKDDTILELIADK